MSDHTPQDDNAQSSRQDSAPDSQLNIPAGLTILILILLGAALVVGILTMLGPSLCTIQSNIVMTI